MKRVKITANELDQAQEWLKNIDYSIDDIPMILASYARDVKVEKFPSLLNLSDEISNLANTIEKIKFSNDKIDYSSFIDGLFLKIDTREFKTYTTYGFNNMMTSLFKVGWKIIEIKIYWHWFKRYEKYFLTR